MASLADRGAQGLGLALALAFVLSVTYLPHLDAGSQDEAAETGALEAWSRVGSAYEDLAQGEQDTYPYPIHVDEHIHWVLASTIQRYDTLDHPEIYTGQESREESITLRGGVHERGFHLGLAQFQDLTGVSWWTVFAYGPAMWAGLVALLVWAALKPWNGAPIAAALTGLMPTTVRFLGPGFLVPITFGLAWVGVVLVLLPRLGRSFRGPALALLTVFWAFFVHLIAGFVALALLLAAIPFVAPRAREQGMRKRLAGIGLAAAVPMIWLYEAFFEEITAEVEALSSLPLDLTVFDQIGFLFLGAWIVGLGVVGYRTPPGKRTQFGAASLLTLVLLATIWSNFHLGPRLALYDRFHQPFLLLAAIPASYAILAGARTLVSAIERGAGSLRDRLGGLGGPGARGRSTRGQARSGLVARGSIAAIVIVLFAAITTPALAAHLDEPYYRVLDEQDVERFTWIEDNVGEEHERFLAHPWKAPILTAMTGKQPHAFLTPGSPPTNGDAYVDYLTGTSNDTRWLLERDIEIVVGPRMPDSDVFEQPREGVSLLLEEHARQQDARRGEPPGG